MTGASISSLEPGEIDTEIAGRTARRINDYLASNPGEDPIEILVEVGDDALVVPRAAAAMFALLMNTVASGQGVSVVPQDAQLTTQQAADMLNVSRPYLIGLLESNKIPYTKVGRHRRIQFANLMDYKRHSDQQSRQAADEMADLGQELGL